MEESTENEGSAVGSYEGMVDNLVTQFSSALDCFRELVQNSIDAGSPRIDIWMEYLAGEGHQGTIAIHVEDFGEGMDEAIIDNELTQLFASTKDDDLTKIGKFGIGFVSVFALQPRAVLVHTGRSGEYWEVLFHEDRSFSKTRVDNPIEGTQITIFLAGEYHRYQELAEDIPATLRHWCNHSTVEVTFEDRTNNDDFSPPEVINEEFLVDGECLQHREHEGTEMVLAYNMRPIYGFYNRGLTLALTDVGDEVLSSWEKRFRFISFKLKSRYLEHTLARDSVIRDEQYERAMTLLERAANEQLLPALLDELERLAAVESLSVEQYHRYALLMSYAAREPAEILDDHAERPLLRCLNTKPLSLAQAWDRLRSDGHLLLSVEPTSLTERLGEQQIPVVMGDTGRVFSPKSDLRSVMRLVTEYCIFKTSTTIRGKFWSALGQLGRMVRLKEERTTESRIRHSLLEPEQVYLSFAVDDQPLEEHRPLIDDAAHLLRTVDADFAKLTTGVAPTDDDAPLFVVAEELGPLMIRPENNERKNAKELEAAIIRNHPQFAVIHRLYEREPAMGAYQLARALLLSEEKTLKAGQFLLDAALPEAKAQYS